MKNIKPDDYYNNGGYEIARFGNSVYAKNIMNDKQHSLMIKELKDRYDELKASIDTNIGEIKKAILNCNPIQLLQCSSDMFKMNNMRLSCSDDLEDSVYNAYDHKPYLATEFIQSVYVSSPVNNNISNDDRSEEFFKIISDIEKLLEQIHLFYFSWGARIRETYSDIDEDSAKLLIEEQMLYTVRGNRYQIFEKEYIRKLLTPHDAVFKEVFGITAKDIISGIESIQYALSQQKFDTFQQFVDIFDKFEQENIDIEQFHSEHEAELNDITGKLFGTKLCEIHEITTWPEILIKELSWEQNSCQDFWNGEFGGWPIVDLPIRKRPFIVIDGKSYCFDYYSFADNIYRSIQKATTRIKHDYQWSSIQQSASERMVAETFESLLPGCKTYLSNYYPINNSLKQMAENDLIVLYDDTLIIVEVKAGSFVYTSPITDFNAHIKSYKKLIEEADLQCHRTREYLKKTDICKIYNQDKSEKVELDMTMYKSIYLMSVTVDNINAFAAKAEKLKFLKLKSNAISIAIDDLMVYREFFDSPLVFLHFLKQRSLATQNPLIALNDELDHLGMYISHNCYNYQTLGIKEGTKVQFVGYRNELDSYFEALYHQELKPIKPTQEIPVLFSQILDYLISQNIPNRCLIANYLLDFASDAKEEFVGQVEYVLNRQKQIKRTIPITTSGSKDSLRYTVFVNQFPYETSIQEQLDYTLATLSWNKEEDRVLISLYFKNDKFEKIDFKIVTANDIDSDNAERIAELGRINAQRRIQEYKRNNPGKIGRNTLCPCGSGKKYKKCCGR